MPRSDSKPGKSRLGSSLALPSTFWGIATHPRVVARRASVLGSLLVICFVVAPGIARSETDAARVKRLFMWASDGNVRHRDLVEPAKDSLGQMGAKAAPWLAKKLSTADARERLTLADIFEKIGKPATPFVVPYLDSAGEDMPRNAARALERIKDTAAVLPLLAHMDHSEYSVRSQVATALGKTGDKRALESLIKHLSSDSDSDVRKSCAVAVGDCGGQDGAEPLIAALSDSSFAARQSALASLIKLKVPLPLLSDHIESAGKAGKDLERCAEVVAVCAISEPRADNLIDKFLKDSDPLVRGFAVEGLGLGLPAQHEARVSALKAKEADPFVLAQIARFEKIALAKKNEQSKPK